MAFAADEITSSEFKDVRSDLDDSPDKLVSDDQRDGNIRLRPRVPGIDVQVRSADPRSQHLYKDVTPTNGWHRNFRQRKARFGRGFNQCQHC
jgi:hypothetical protein